MLGMTACGVWPVRAPFVSHNFIRLSKISLGLFIVAVAAGPIGDRAL
jgi:hypothetical protein